MHRLALASAVLAILLCAISDAQPDVVQHQRIQQDDHGAVNKRQTTFSSISQVCCDYTPFKFLANAG